MKTERRKEVEITTEIAAKVTIAMACLIGGIFAGWWVIGWLIEELAR